MSIRIRLRRTGRAAALCAAGILITAGLGATHAAAATPTASPTPTTPTTTAAASTADAGGAIDAAKALQAVALPGANDWNCKPGAAHPRPVVLVHGTFVTGTLNWIELAPLLKARGYCVFAPTYGRMPNIPALAAIAPMERSAAELKTFVDGVLAATGASKIDMVGHSQGGLLPRYYQKFLGGAEKTERYIALAPTSHGTTLSGLATLLQSIKGAPEALLESWCPGCLDQTPGSAFLQKVNAGGDTAPGVEYTVISTKLDYIVTPVASQFLQGPNVRNLYTQDMCWYDLAQHATMQVDSEVLHEVMNVLDPANATRTGCRILP
ncbi:esterase/lipase family protein [Streptomyces sp. NBC_01237]|uniref:esterase/lipase family protein n=1 Tax=Streptomyces sp. NBC_01237 TaxID=2903790 RepID=UPI002DDB060E|nr:alpha/beta fold hydrolase [Streptomyces sp. NBC_01237]WRZ70837.1 lipase family protein [Streptomyces sp. NBC_01237]